MIRKRKMYRIDETKLKMIRNASKTCRVNQLRGVREYHVGAKTPGDFSSKPRRADAT